MRFCPFAQSAFEAEHEPIVNDSMMCNVNDTMCCGLFGARGLVS